MPAHRAQRRPGAPFTGRDPLPWPGRTVAGHSVKECSGIPLSWNDLWKTWVFHMRYINSVIA